MTEKPPAALPASLRLQPRQDPLAEITAKLLDYLLSGDIAPGTKIPSERVLADAIGISRSTLREVVKSLALLGLLRVRQGDGTYLSDSGSQLLPHVIEWGLLLDRPNTQHMAEARAEIETLTAGLAAEHATDQQIKHLQQQLAAMPTAGDVDAYLDADAALHGTIAQLANNQVYMSLVTSLHSLLRAEIGQSLQGARATRASTKEHKAIVAAIVARDAEGARDAMRAHLHRGHTTT